MPAALLPVFRLLLLGIGLLGAGVAPAQTSGKQVARPAAKSVGKPPKTAFTASGCPVQVPTPAVARLLAEAHRLQADYHESEALGRYERVLAKDPDTYAALWEAAVLSVRIGSRYTDETRKLAYLAAARLYAKKALTVCPDGAEAHYAAGLALATQAPLLPLRSRLLAYRDMRPHVYRATELRPDWAEAWQLLGRWQYRVDHYSLPERLYSKLFMGGMPVGGSTLLAIESLRMAHELAPQRIEHAYDLARVHLNRSQETRATAVLQAALEITPVTADELVMSRRCERLLEQLNRRKRRQLQRLINEL